MRDIKQLSNLVEDTEQKERVTQLLRKIRHEMLNLSSDFGIHTNAVAYVSTENVMLESFTDERAMNASSRLNKVIVSRFDAAEEDTEDSEDEDEDLPAFIQRKMFKKDQR